MKKITILIPCYNEELGVGQVIDSIPKKKLEGLGYKTEIIVIDNNSRDRTSEIAKKKGVRLIEETRQGKGYAVLTGFKSVSRDTSIVVMIDGDNSYKGQELLRMIEPIDNNFASVVVGTRLSGRMAKDSMTFFNRVGNWLFTFLVRLAYDGNVTDVCTGYYAWKREVVDDMVHNINASGFSLEMEMITKIAKMGHLICSVPISYDNRTGQTNLRPIADGSKIMLAWARNIFWRPDHG